MNNHNSENNNAINKQIVIFDSLAQQIWSGLKFHDKENPLWLPKQLILESVSCSEQENNTPIHFLLLKPINPLLLSSSNENDTPSFVVVTKGKKKWEGQLYTTNYPPNDINLMDITLIDSKHEKLIFIENADSIETKIQNMQLLQPKLIMTGDYNEKENDIRYRVQFLQDGISWNVHYDLFIDDTHILYYVLKAVVKNQTDENLLADTLRLMTKQVDTGNNVGPLPMVMMAESRSAQSSYHAPVDSKTQDITEYESFIIDNAMIKMNDISVFPLYTETNLSIQQKFFFHDLNNHRTRWGFRFEPHTFLPSGIVDIYHNNGVFLGKTHLRSTTKGELTDILLGTPSNVYILSSISSENQLNIIQSDESYLTSNKNFEAKGIEKKEINIEIVNHKQDEVISVLLRYNIGCSAYSANPPPTRLKNHHLEWIVNNVKPNTKYQMTILLNLSETSC